MKQDRITLAQGSGGIESQNLIAQTFAPYLQLKHHNEDAGIFKNLGSMAVSTDAYTISPLFFPGGDIGKLSVCGSFNDVAMMGAKPLYLTCSFVIEEGFLKTDLEKILASMSAEIKKAQVQILSGDTKVVEKGGIKGITITTTALGEVVYQGLSAQNLKIGDQIILTSYAGTHGALIYALRQEITLHTTLQSDCAQLYPLLAPLFEAGIHIHALRDATRGGVAAVLNEWANASEVGICVDKESIPLKKEVRGIMEFLGLDPLCLANEGAALIALDSKSAQKALDILHTQGATSACIIGEVKAEHPKRVIGVQHIGNLKSKQFIEYPSGEILPRIC